MEGSRDSNSNIRSSNEIEDDSGLELSLGLSYGCSRGKGKEVEGLTDSFSDRIGSGEGVSRKTKHAKAYGLDAALKRFLQGRLDEQEESARILDGYLRQHGSRPDAAGISSKNETSSINSLPRSAFPSHPCGSNMKNPGIQRKGLQENSGPSEVQTAVEAKEVTLINNDPETPATVVDATAWGQLQQQGIPAHLIDALKNAAVGGPGLDHNRIMVPTLAPHLEALSTASGQNSHSSIDVPQDAGQSDSKKSEQPRQQLIHREILEQQRKFQEARKKRKHLIEEQKQQKKNRKEDDMIGSHGFRRPGSNTWVRGFEAPSSPSLEAGDDGELFQRDKDGIAREKSLDIDQEESSETLGYCKESERFPVQRPKTVEYSGFSPPTSVGTVSLDKTQSGEWKQRPRELPTTTNYQLNIIESSQEKNWKNSYGSCEPSSSLLKKETGKGSCQNSSTGSQGSEKKEVRSCSRSSPGDGEISSAPPISSGSESGSGPASRFLFPSTSVTSAFPYPLPSLSVVPMPYSLPVPLANAPGMPFPVGFSFPYLMHFVPPAGDPNATRPPHTNSYQLSATQGYIPYQIPPVETATSWVPIVHPPTAFTSCIPSSGVAISRMASGVREEDNKKAQGPNVPENVPRQTPATITDALIQQNSLFYRTASPSTYDSVAALAQLQQEASSYHPSPYPVTSGAQLRILQPNPGESIFKDQTGVGVFPGFVTSAQSTQGLGCLARPVLSNMDEGQKQELTGQIWARSDDARNKDVKNLDHQEELGKGLGAPFQKGSTENLPVLDGLSPEIFGLRPGIATGLKFGGTGSSPDLPWVSATGTGPNGKTISGVLYRYSTCQVRIVCACHGRHMPPREFVLHANGDSSNSEKSSIVVNSVPLTSQAASAQGTLDLQFLRDFEQYLGRISLQFNEARTKNTACRWGKGSLFCKGNKMESHKHD